MSEHCQEHAKRDHPVSLRAKLTFGFVQRDLRLAPVVFNFVVQMERLLWRHFGASARRPTDTHREQMPHLGRFVLQVLLCSQSALPRNGSGYVSLQPHLFPLGFSSIVRECVIDSTDAVRSGQALSS